MRKAMIVAAGLGTRLRPLTDNMPKALVRVGEKPLLRLVIERLAEFGYDDIVVNVHHFAGMIEEYLRAEGLLDVAGCGGVQEAGDASEGGLAASALSGGVVEVDTGREGAAEAGALSGVRVRISDERDFLRDTGGGIRHAEALLRDSGGKGGRFLVHNVDILSNLDLRLLDEAFPPDALALLAVSDRKTSRYLLFDDNMRLVGWTNISTGEVRSPYSNLNPASCHCYAFSGIQMISDRIFDIFESEHFGEKFSIIDFYLRIAAKYPIYGFVPDNLHLLDVGKLDILEKLNSTGLQEFIR